MCVCVCVLPEEGARDKGVSANSSSQKMKFICGFSVLLARGAGSKTEVGGCGVESVNPGGCVRCFAFLDSMSSSILRKISR